MSSSARPAHVIRHTETAQGLALRAMCADRARAVAKKARLFCAGQGMPGDQAMHPGRKPRRDNPAPRCFRLAAWSHDKHFVHRTLIASTTRFARRRKCCRRARFRGCLGDLGACAGFLCSAEPPMIDVAHVGQRPTPGTKFRECGASELRRRSASEPGSCHASGLRLKSRTGTPTRGLEARGRSTETQRAARS